MRLYRGVRHPNGRHDVVVSKDREDGWLRPGASSDRKGKLEYAWGDDGPGARMLSLDLLTDALDQEMLAEMLAEEFCAVWIAHIQLDRWTFADWEIVAWALDEVTCRLEEGEARRKGGVPCPSEN